MSITMTQTRAAESNYGGFADALGGIATMILAIFGLAGVAPNVMLPIAVIVFGVALLIQGGTMLSEYAGLMLPAGTVEEFGGESLAALFVVGGAGIMLGVLALIGINPVILEAVAIIAFGSGLVMSSSSLKHLQFLKTTMSEPSFGAEVLANEMAAGSAGTQALTGLAAIVLGVLTIVGVGPEGVLSLVAMLALGATVVLTGSSLSGVGLSSMKPVSSGDERQAGFPESPYQS